MAAFREAASVMPWVRSHSAASLMEQVMGLRVNSFFINNASLQGFYGIVQITAAA